MAPLAVGEMAPPAVGKIAPPAIGETTPLAKSAQPSGRSDKTTAETQASPSPHYLAEIKLNTAHEFQAVLQRAERLYAQGHFEGGVAENDGVQNVAAPKASPVAFLLHGAEAKVLLKSNYENNREIVNLAARLSAFEVVEIRVCDAWMERNNINPGQLPPFVGTVRYAPAEKKRLRKEEDYVYF